ncbi:MAG: endonuclease domain-containing protein [Chloroflexi bacterium]|nr:endonuclease domain-containing protein [Chloroflexota bacterium]
MNVAEQTLEAQLSQAGIPFEREYRFHPERRWRADFMVGQNFAWPIRGRYLIEIDGGAFIAGRHVRGKGFEADLEKLNAAALLGFRVLRFTPAHVEDGRALDVIRQALGIEVAA